MVSYIGIVTEGIEDIAAQEVQGKIKSKGRIIFEKEKKEYCTVDTVYELEEEFTFEDQEDIREKVEKKQWQIKEPFRVTCRREGKHLFTANDIERDLGELIHEQGYAVSLKEPKTTIYVDIEENMCRIGKLVEDDLDKRAYRVRRGSTAISASLAAAMIKIAEITPEDSMLDPLCKDGVIAIEAARQGIKNIAATDTIENNVRNAKINAKMAKVNINWEPKKENVEYVITNLWVPAKFEGAKQFAGKFLEWQKEKVEKKIIILTNWTGIEKKIPEGLVIEAKRLVKRGEIKNYIFILGKRSS